MRRLPHAAARGRTLTLDLEGKAVPALEGEPLAAALVAAGEDVFCRAAEDGLPRGAYCFAALCGQCRMRVDGIDGVFTCRTPARAGMRLARQDASARRALETLAWILPRERQGGGPLDEPGLARIVGELVGMGMLPEGAPPPLLPARELKTCVAVVGGGAAGLAAVSVLGARGLPFLLFEQEAHIGGRLRSGAPEPEAPELLDPGTLPSSSLRRGCTAVGLHEDAAGRYLLVLAIEPVGLRLTKVYAERFLLTAGSVPAAPPFARGGLPGVYAGRALSLLARVYGVAPEAVVLTGWGAELYALARLLAGAGTAVRGIVDLRGPLPADAPAVACVASDPEVHGEGAVTAFSFTPRGAALRRLECEVLAVCVPPQPSVELARQGDARVACADAGGAPCVQVDSEGRTSATDLFAAGELTGAVDARAAAEAGRCAAEAIVRELR